VRILFDQGTPVPLRKLLSSHQVETVFERGWSTLTNGELLAVAEREGFEVLVTTDKNLRDQQNVAELSIAIVVLSSTSWPRIQKAAATIKEAVDAASPGSFNEVGIP
jgi:predicted nuclease of predicted toxin-antitoxin system